MRNKLKREKLVEAMAEAIRERLPSSPFLELDNDPTGIKWATETSKDIANAALDALIDALPTCEISDDDIHNMTIDYDILDIYQQLKEMKR